MRNSKLIPALILAVASFFTLNAQDIKPTFQDFLAQFPKAELPYTFSVESLQSQIETRANNKIQALGWEYYEFLPELERSAIYSSMPVHPEPVAAFETDNYTAVVYNLARGLARGKKTYSVSVFTKEGEYIGTHFVAGVNPHILTSVTINEDLVANVLEYKITWEKEYSSNGPIDNSISNLTLIENGKLKLPSAGNPDKLEWASRSAVVNTQIAETK